MKPEKLHPSQLTSASMMSYEDLPSHKVLMTGNEKHYFSSESTLDVLSGLNERVPKDRAASSKRPGFAMGFCSPRGKTRWPAMTYWRRRGLFRWKHSPC